MNADQNKAVDVANGGHNLLITGHAGTGKSYVLQKVYESLRARGKRVQITCATGIACSIYESAITLHRFLGLGDGRYGPEEINQVHQKNAFYNYVRINLEQIDCLIVDECSMVSRRTFESLLSVCGRRETPLQLIICGDFLQLPPVPNERYCDYGEFCFHSPLFLTTYPHKIVLCELFRAREPQLVKAIGDVFSGDLSKESEAFIKSLNRPLNPNCESVKLFSTNQLVDDYNRRKILDFPGDLYELVANDCGDQGALDKMPGPRTLWLKKGCPVILLQNLSDKLYNGLRGFALNMSAEGITVNFPSINETRMIALAKFTGIITINKNP